MYRYSVLVAAATLALIVSGAIVTTSKVGGTVHTILAILVGVLAAGLAIWQKSWVGWSALVILIVDAVLGWRTPPLSVMHACLAPVFFSAVIAIAVLPARPELVKDRGAALLRFIAIATPPLVLMQIALGAAYRHQMTGVMPHMTGAMIVSLLTLVVCMIVIQRFPKHRSLFFAAVSLMTIVLVQVSLGITAFIMRLLDTENTPWFVVSAVSHVAVGALTLAASVVLAIQILRHVRHDPAQQANQERHTV